VKIFRTCFVFWKIIDLCFLSKRLSSGTRPDTTGASFINTYNFGGIENFQIFLDFYCAVHYIKTVDSSWLMIHS